MGRVHYEESSASEFEDFKPVEENVYREPISVHFSEDWDTLMEDFLDDFDDYQDVDFPAADDDI